MVALQVPVAAQSDCRRRCAGRRDYLPSSTSRPTTTPARSPPDLRHAARLVVAQNDQPELWTHINTRQASTVPAQVESSPAVSKLSAAPPHVALRRTMATCPATSLSTADVVRRRAAEGLVKGCGWHGMQGVRGSNPLSSTTKNPQLNRRVASGLSTPLPPRPGLGAHLGHGGQGHRQRSAITATTRACIASVMCR